MFTGLVESTTTVLSLTPIDGGAKLSYTLPFTDISIGDSIATNGCCLTVAEIVGNVASFDLLAQTLRITNLGLLKAGDTLNLERAMKLDTRLGGHIVSGHIDGVGSILNLEAVGQDYRLEIEPPVSLLHYCIDKGSLTVNGISLTIATLKDKTLEFWITPHTMKATNLHTLKKGSRVNLEVDLMAKYVERLMQKTEA